MDSVLVTGGCGFIGTHLVDVLLKCGNEVTILDHKKSVIDGVKSFKGDIRNIKDVNAAVGNAGTIFHLAAQVSVPNSIKDPRLDAETNVLGTLNILEAARKNGAQVIYASSAAVYGETEYTPIDEKHPKNPVSPYGISKLVAEKYCLAYSSNYGVKTVITRFSNAYGPGTRKAVVYDFISNILRKKGIRVDGTGEQKRDFIYVKDIVEGLIAARKSKSGEIYNISTGVGISINQMIGTLKGMLGDFPVEHGPQRAGDIMESVLSNNKATEEIDFKIRYSPKDALQETIEWIRGASA